MDLQPLFPDPILAKSAYPAAYTDHTNDVWRVRTATEDVVARVPRPEAALVSPFWVGCQHLFGLDPARPDRLAPINALLSQLSPIPVPRVLRSGTVGGRRCLVVEHLPGERLLDLRALPPGALAELGATLARIHRHRLDWCGAPDGGVRFPLAELHGRMTTTMRAIVNRFYRHDPAIAGALDGFSAAALRLPPPDSAALVMIDVDATQFLTDGARITALVDTDAYAVAPRELDFIGYEYELDGPGAVAFAEGYHAVLPLPDLTQVRPIYRYLYRLLGVQGAVPLEEWLAWPAWFGG